MKREVLLFVEKFVEEIRAENAAVFLGAGASKAAGHVDWVELLEPLARELELDASKEPDLVALAQFYVNETRSRGQINQTILDALGRNLEPTENHRILAGLDIPVYWTTNYDRLIEEALREAGKIADVKHTVKQLANTRSRRDAIVYKMHGDVEHPDEAILTKDNYEKYFKTHGAFVTALSGHLVSKTFVFIGFSFSDPNLDYVLSRVRVTFEEHQRRHFAFFKKRSKAEGETEEDFQMAQTRQRLMIEDLKRFNVNSILVDEYDEITEALREVARRFRMRTVFVSSSAADFSPWGEQAVTNFMRKLGSLLVENSLRISTGLGLGVGNALFTGALEEVYRNVERQIDDHLLVRPFPQYVEDKTEREALWHKYRSDFIPSAGSALFLFGNKMAGDEIVPANGMVTEFDIAAENGLVLLPVGATGSTAADLAARVLADPENYPSIPRDLVPLIEKLNEPVDSLSELLQPLVELIRKAGAI